jgi:hypothetical protein
MIGGLQRIVTAPKPPYIFFCTARISSQARYIICMFLLKLRYFGSVSFLQLHYLIVKARRFRFRFSNLRLKFRLLRLESLNYIESLFILLKLAKAIKKVRAILDDGRGQSGVEHVLAFLQSLSDGSHKSHTERHPNTSVEVLLPLRSGNLDIAV